MITNYVRTDEDGKRWLIGPKRDVYILPRVNVRVAKKNAIEFSYTGVKKKYRKEVKVNLRDILRVYLEFVNQIILVDEIYDHNCTPRLIGMQAHKGCTAFVRINRNIVRVYNPFFKGSTYIGTLSNRDSIIRANLLAGSILKELLSYKITSVRDIPWS